MSEMVERVVLVLKNALASQVGLSVDCGGLARSAIAAMREPTGAMVSAGMDKTGWPICNMEVIFRYEAMIDAALGEGES